MVAIAAIIGTIGATLDFTRRIPPVAMHRSPSMDPPTR
jgi:hypothetical protein